MFQKENIFRAVKFGFLGALLGAGVAMFVGANLTGILMAAAGVFVAALIALITQKLWGYMLGMAVMGGVFGYITVGVRGMIGGMLGGAAYPLALRSLPGRWGSGVGLFLLFAIPGVVISTSWRGALGAALSGLIFVMIFETGRWLSSKLRRNQQ